MFSKLKIQNIKNIMLQLLADGTATKQGIVQKTGLSNTTVSDAINSMLRLGCVFADGAEDSIGGRRSAIYKINNYYGQFLGIEMRYNGLYILWCDACGHKIGERFITKMEQEPPIRLLYRAIETVLALPEVSNPLAIGIGLEGAMDHENQIVIESQMLSWQNVHLKEIIERQFYIPTYIDSAINGQIGFQRFIKQLDKSSNILIISESFHYKVAICLDGTICRGTTNVCGTIPTFGDALTYILPMAESLDIERLLIGYQSPQYEEEIKNLFDTNGRVQIQACLVKDGDLAQGMALMAETWWFESIYFLLQ